MSSHDRDPHYNAHYNAEDWCTNAEYIASRNDWADEQAFKRFVAANPVSALKMILAAVKAENNQ